jgi:SAM-dependent methyltransferase
MTLLAFDRREMVRSGAMPVSRSLLWRRTAVRVLSKCFGQPFLRPNEWMWRRLPASFLDIRPARRYGIFLHWLVKLRSERRQYHGTFFLRNRPELELMRAIAGKRERGATLRIGVVACSNGAEVYSIVWAIRSVRPDLKLVVHAVDISGEVVEIAMQGLYPLEMQQLIGSNIFERLTNEEFRQIFSRERDWVKVQPWLKDNIEWHVGDAGDPELALRLGALDIVVANKFLCHMDPPEAEQCVRKVAQLVRPGGHLFVSGVDLDLRTRIALELGWVPVKELIEEIHDGDPSVRRDWPWRYWGLEPFDRRKPHWEVRYASVFQLGKPEARVNGWSTESPGEEREILST